MKKLLHLFATSLCLLALQLPATALCVLQPQHLSQAACSHCPQPNHSLPACCSAHRQQPPSIVTSHGSELMLQHAGATTPSRFDNLPLFLSLLPAAAETPPHRNSLIALRI